MRFRTLSIRAFGPFSGFAANFGDGRPDFHLVYGPNEAGKSSLLRAITALLYGIPNRSADNFLHDYADLSLAAQIQNRDGASLSFTRSKGRKNTIRGDDGIALDDSVLAPFIGAVDETYFKSVFGLDSDELKKGAESLLSRDGDLGQALLATGTGGSLVQRTLEQFVARSEHYYRGRAHKDVTIRPAVKVLKEQQRAVREHTVATRQWQQLERQLEEKQQAVAELADRCAALERELDWIARCRDALPPVAQYKDKTEQIQALPSLPPLPDDFAERARHARDQAERSAAALQRERANVARLTEQLGQCATAPAVLAEAAALDDLHTRLEVYRNRCERLSELRSDMSAREVELVAGMQAFSLHGAIDQLESLRIAPALQLAFDEAADALDAAQQALDHNHSEAEKIAHGVALDQTALEGVPAEVPAALLRAIDSAGDARQYSRTLPQLIAGVERMQRELAQARALLPGTALDGEALTGLSVPSAATVRRFREQLADERREIEQLSARRDEQAAELKELRAELKRLQQGRELPSAQALQQARKSRDAMWQRVVADWQASRDSGQADIDFALQLAYPAAVIDADRLADALADDADRVARGEQLRARIKACEAAVRQLDQGLLQWRELHAGALADWQSQWSACQVEATTPAEMEEWREHWLAYRAIALELAGAQGEIHRQQQLLNAAIDALAGALASDGDRPHRDFEELYRLARERRGEREAAIGKRAEIQDRIRGQTLKLEQLQADSVRLSRDQQRARDDWQRRCREAGLAADSSVPAGRKLLQQRLQLLSRYDEWCKLSVEFRAIEEQVDSYQRRVDDYSARLAIAGDSVQARQQALWSALTAARQAQLRHSTLADQLQHAQDGLDKAQLAAQQAAERLDHIKSLAQLAVTGELEPLLAMIEQRERLAQDAETHRQALIGLARGEPVGEFMQRVQLEDSELLGARQTELEREKSQKLEQLQALRDEAGSLVRELDQLGRAGDLAATHSQRAESVSAALASDAREYMVLRLATAFLERQRERYREQNQAPLLAASSSIFKAVTLGSFERLVPDYDARDEAVIVGERADGSRVPVEGMSEGSRDQLYLSLRLAALQQHMQSSEPMPLIMDDLLMTFDDQRSGAMLRQIASLAQHTQVFLFTHHRHMIELCHSELSEGEFALHRI